MRQVKLFKGIESELGKLEQEINDWIKSSGAQVVNICGNIAPQSQNKGDTSPSLAGSAYVPSDVLMIVVYEA